MEPTDKYDDVPFVNEECGDTMWDETVLNQLINTMEQRPPLPPFTLETAREKVQKAEDAWNTKDPDRVSLACTPDTEWRNRTEFINGREEVRAFPTRKWEKELDYRLKKELCRAAGAGIPRKPNGGALRVRPGRRSDGTMPMTSGFAPAAMSYGSLTKTA